MERSLSALEPHANIMSVLGSRLLGLAFTAQGQNAPIQRDLHLLRIHSGQIDGELEAILELVDVDGGYPARGRTAGFHLIQAAEQAIDLLAQLAERGQVPGPIPIRNDCHKFHPPIPMNFR